MLIVVLAAAYYVALNVALIHELVDRVQAGSRPSASMVNKVSVMLGEQRRERRAALGDERAAPARAAAMDGESGAERR